MTIFASPAPGAGWRSTACCARFANGSNGWLRAIDR
jgi:hypothetical protein